MPYDGGAKAAFEGLVKDDPEINVTVEDLENGQQFVNLKGEGRTPGTRCGRSSRSGGSREREPLRGGLPRPRRLWLLLLFVVPLGFVLAISFGTTDDLGEALYGWHLDNYRRVFDPDFTPVLRARSATPWPPSRSAS